MDLSILRGCSYCVIGDPVAHSRSPQMQNAAFAGCGMPDRYGKLRVAADELPAFAEFAGKRLKGFNVTVPHKQAILPLLDRIDPDAALCRSVNTVRVENGLLNGFSTDGEGVLFALRNELNLTVAGAVITMIGAGGAARAAAFALRKAGAKKIWIANRTRCHGEELAKALGGCAESVAMADLRDALQISGCVLQCSSCGLKESDSSPFDPELLAGLSLSVFDMIYRRTALLAAAEKLGLPCASGREMLIGQGAASFAIWTGKQPSVEAMRQGFAEENA